jgi:hypothetical protein
LCAYILVVSSSVFARIQMRAQKQNLCGRRTIMPTALTQRGAHWCSRSFLRAPLFRMLHSRLMTLLALFSCAPRVLYISTPLHALLQMCEKFTRTLLSERVKCVYSVYSCFSIDTFLKAVNCAYIEKSVTDWAIQVSSYNWIEHFLFIYDNNIC